MWAQWWLWVVGGLILGILEIVAPAFIFLGFAIGAVLTGIILWLGLPLSGWMGESLPRHFLVFGVLSLIAWIVLRSIFGIRKGQVRIVHHDINED